MENSPNKPKTFTSNLVSIRVENLAKLHFLWISILTCNFSDFCFLHSIFLTLESEIHLTYNGSDVNNLLNLVIRWDFVGKEKFSGFGHLF